MNVVLLANGLTDRGEHSYRLIQEVRRTLMRRGIGCDVYAARSLDPAIIGEKIATPHFRYSLYDSVGPRMPEILAGMLDKRWPAGSRLLSYLPEFLTWKILNRSFRRDLEALPPDCCTADQLLVITAICQNQLSGVIDFMLSRPLRSLPHVVCHLMFLPNWTPWEGSARFGDVYYRQAFQRASPLIGRKLFFTTENYPIAEIYRENYGIDAKILPVPLAISRFSGAVGKTIRLGFFGYSKGSKGFHLLPDAVEICRNAGLDVEFRIQIQHSRWERATVQAERRLRSMPNVHLIEGVLPSDDYIAETNKVDAVLLPYDPIRFGMRGSGVFTESVSAGRPIVASEGTFAADSIRIGEAQGEIFAPYNAQELANAIARILPRIPQIHAGAAARAEIFASTHNGEAYVDALLSLLRSGDTAGARPQLEYPTPEQ
jgi:glycosyltransferase involved in cell wall biosynthesis